LLRFMARYPQILGGADKPISVIFEMPQRNVASVTKQAANLARAVTVINGKKLYFAVADCCFRLTAYGAQSALLIAHSIIVIYVNTKPALQYNGPVNVRVGQPVRAAFRLDLFGVLPIIHSAAFPGLFDSHSEGSSNSTASTLYSLRSTAH
jgi:hypothetical protein